VERRANRRLAALLGALGTAVVAALAAIGFDYYVLPVGARSASPLHELMRPAGAWGHSVGIASTLFMLTTLSYSARKRLAALKGKGSIQRALVFHVFAGTLSPVLIAFHAAFLAENLLALWTWVALAIVVATGVFGRVLLPWVPAAEGRALSYEELRRRLGDLERDLAPRFAESMSPRVVQTLFSAARTTLLPDRFWAAVLALPRVTRETRQALLAARPLFVDEAVFERLREQVIDLSRAKFHLLFHREMRVVSKYWLIVHVVLSVFMLALLTAHIAVSLYLGFRWVMP
jgi:dihydropyrimidine dehydrogenase (NAD+) subunit PreT